MDNCYEEPLSLPLVPLSVVSSVFTFPNAGSLELSGVDMCAPAGLKYPPSLVNSAGADSPVDWLPLYFLTPNLPVVTDRKTGAKNTFWTCLGSE